MQHATRFVVLPILLGAVVLALSLSLVTVIAAGPYTHANLNRVYDPGYTRTEQTFVGDPVPFPGDQLGVFLAPKPVDRGGQLFVSKGCASCHGLDGHGGIVGPDLKGMTADDLRNTTTDGAKGMPKFAHGALSDDDLASIVAYLQSTGQK